MKGFRHWALVGFSIAGTLLIALTVLPVLETNEWWVRIWDYPRPQLLAVSVVTLVVLLLLSPTWKRRSFIIPVALMLATAFQAWRMVTYTQLWPVEMASAESEGGDACVSIMIANVLMENRESQRLRELIDAEQPDILFIVENDGWWSRELASISARYPLVIDEPKDNTYGLLFMTSLSAGDVELRHLSEPDIPSIRAALKLPSGQGFTFYGLHPTPPRLGQDTDVRDHELTRVAREVREAQRPSIVGGDLNDVAWSHTTRLFKRVSRMLDPRQGRGLYASFHADYPLLRWPLDHLFGTDVFEIGRLAVLPHIGSDHFPVIAEFCLRDDAANDNASQKQMRGNDREEVRETLESD